MWRNHLCAVIGSLSCSVGVATAADRPKTYDEMIARQAEIHGLPEALVHRIVKRESRYQPGLVHRHCFGLMQIKYATAREMGYKGDAKGLLDPKINLTYAVPYLANAYRLADGDGSRRNAVQQRLYGASKEGARHITDRILSAGRLRAATAQISRADIADSL